MTKCILRRAGCYQIAEKVQQNICLEIIFIIHIDHILCPLCYITPTDGKGARETVDRAEPSMVINDRPHWGISEAVSVD